VALLIFLFTLLLIVWHLQGLGIGLDTLTGTMFTPVNSVSLTEVLTVSATVGNTILTLIALLILCRILDHAGLWRRLALQLAVLGISQGRLLFLLCSLLGALGTIVLTNVGMALIWISPVMEILCLLRLRAKTVFAVVFTVSFITEAASLLFPVSNPVNLLAVNYSDISGFRYILVMTPVTFVAIATSLASFWFYFHRDIRCTYKLTHLPLPHQAIRDPLVCRWGMVILASLPLAYWIAQDHTLPTWIVAAIAALILLGLAGRWFYPNTTPIISVGNVWQEIPWRLIGFSLLMYGVVLGLGQIGMSHVITHQLEALSSWGLTLTAIGTGFLATGLSNLFQNLPTVLLNAVAISDTTTDPAIREVMEYANVIGCTLGAKITPLGSLSTLIWFQVLARQGLRLHWLYSIRLSLILTLPILFLSLLSLALWLPWLIV
jgi:arsenical pump membrane protein